MAVVVVVVVVVVMMVLVAVRVGMVVADRSERSGAGEE